MPGDLPGRGVQSYTFNGVALATRSLELVLQEVDSLALVGHELPYALRHPVVDSRELLSDRVHVRIPAAVALALAPEASVLIAQVGDRTAHLALHTTPFARLRTWNLLAAVAAKNKDAAHRLLRSDTFALLSSRKRSGSISNTESGRPAAAHTTP